MLREELEKVLGADDWTDAELQEFCEIMSTPSAALCDTRSATEKEKLTAGEKERLRQEAAKEIQEIPALRGQWEDFRVKGQPGKIPLADLYAWILTGNEKIRSLDFALKTLIKMLKDGRIPQKHKGDPKNQAPAAIRLAIAAVYGAKEKEFQENLERVPKMIENFYVARDQGRSRVMERIIYQLAAPYFKGPLAQHNKCKLADLKHLFNRLQQEVDAVKRAAQ